MSNRSIAGLAWLVAMSAMWAIFIFNGLSLVALGWVTALGLGALVLAARLGSGSARSIATLLDDLDAEPAAARAGNEGDGERPHLRR